MAKNPTLAAYVLLGDPAFIEASVASYYDVVDVIVASYDKEGIGWSGHPLRVEEAIERLSALDHKSKVQWCPGDYHSERLPHLMQMATRQRQAAFDAAAEHSEWVIQLDTDEVLLDTTSFVGAIADAAKGGFQGLYYPARWLYVQLGSRLYLERSTRVRTWHAYPGSVASPRGTVLELERIHPGRFLKCMWRRHPDADRVIRKNEAIAHFSTIRSIDEMVEKSRVNSHASDFDWPESLKEWDRSRRRPFSTVIRSSLRREDTGQALRPARLPRTYVDGTP